MGLQLLAEGNHVGEMGKDALKEVPVKGVATMKLGGETNILMLVETHHVGDPKRHVLLAQLVENAATVPVNGGQDATDSVSMQMSIYYVPEEHRKSSFFSAHTSLSFFL